MGDVYNFPKQALPAKSKTINWRKKVLDWADSKSFCNYSVCRQSVYHKKINYDLIKGTLHIKDLKAILNPNDIQADFISEQIPHYSIILPKLRVLQGEEYKRVFDYKVVVTNPNAVSEIEEAKKKELSQKLQEWIQTNYKNEQEADEALTGINDYFMYSWQDMREQRANLLLNHYFKQYNIKNMFNNGFLDALTVGEEIYQCTIEGGEPMLRKLNPLNISVIKSGRSNRIEDADIIIIEEYWSPGRIIDTYYQELTKEDIKYLETKSDSYTEHTDEMGNIDPRYGMVNLDAVKGVDNSFNESLFSSITNNYDTSLMPYDMVGNIRVLRVYWKSKRKIKKVKYYDGSGDPQYDFYDESYVIDKTKGEEEEIYYINQAWEGTKIGEDIYVNMRPCPVQYNSLSNPSKCHFGIIGTLYNINEDVPFSLVDTMKPYNYLYDVIHDRLNKLIARNWGTLVDFDVSKKPKNWSMDKWMYFAKTLGLYVTDSFNEGREGAATGKLAGALNNASRGVINANDANAMQQYVQMLSFIKNEMSEVAGITPQREGQISNRETVGGVERATLQSALITEWVYIPHDDLKKRVLEAFIETAKIALKGNSKKFQYILPDGALKMVEIDGDEFAECDYGLVVDNSDDAQRLAQQMETIAQAGLQNGLLNFSALLKLYSTSSLAEKFRYIVKYEQESQQQKAQEQQQAIQMQQQQLQQAEQMKQAELDQQYRIASEANETKLKIAQMQLGAKEIAADTDINDRKLQEDARQFDLNMQFNRDKLAKETALENKKIEVAAKQQASKVNNDNHK